MPDATADQSILLVDTGQTIPETLVEQVEQDSDRSVITTSNLETARATLASDPIDCLLLTIDPIGDNDREFVTDARTISPGVTIIGLTTRGRETVSDDLVEQATTIVEYADDSDNWAFLSEKIRAAGRTADTKEDDYQRYRTLVETAQDGLYRLDANGDLVYTNDSWAEMLGYSRGEMLGAHASLAMADGELERGQRLIQQVLDDDDRDSDVMDVEMVTQDGDRLIVSVRFVVLTTEDGEYDGVMGVARDVTERRERERELERKNERLEQFASIVSHDLRNPLMTAEGYLELARENGRAEDFDRVEESLDRMNRIIDDVLWLAREGTELGETELIALYDQVMTAWRIVTGDHSEATLQVPDEEMGLLRADETRFGQLLENLFRNAIDHGGPDVVVRVHRTENGFVVADDGPGIPVDDREAVFERGYSTSSDGTGFGLAIVEEIVDAHGWDVTVRDNDLGGAAFVISDIDPVPTET